MSRMKINPFRYKTSKFFSILGLFSFFAFIATPTASYAATITVVDMNDAVSNSVMCTLRDAISAINSGADNGCTAVGVYGTADTINVPAGTYTLMPNLQGPEDANWTGDLDIAKAVTIIGTGVGTTIIQAGTLGYPSIPNGVDRVFHVTVNVPTTFDGMTIQNGQILGGGGDGGGINSMGALTVINSSVSNNTDASGGNNGGGGIYAFVSLTLTNSTVSNNDSDTDPSFGGGFYTRGWAILTNSVVSGNITFDNGGGFYAFGNVTLNNSTISGNNGSPGGGFSTRGVVTMNGSTISGNTAGLAGGFDTTNSANLTNSTVSGNTATRGAGGMSVSGPLTLNNSTISGNSAAQWNANGGGIFARITVTMSGSTVSNNTAGSSYGGVYAGGAVTLTNSTVSGNTAIWDGGGISSSGAVTLTNSTIFGNSAGRSGGGLYGIGAPFSLSTSNSIIANNTGGDCFKTGGTFTSTGYNIDSDNTCNLVGVGDLPLTNPLLGALANNGGPTMTHALLPGSPAIDANLACTGSQPVDQRNRARGGDGDNDAISGCDIGAYEASAYGCTDPTATNYDPLAVLDSGRCTYPPAATKSITITVDVEDGQGGKTTNTLKLTPQ